MAVNTKKHGYSCAEVGQIIGCTLQTVRNRVDRGEISASVLDSHKPGGRRTIRISREQLREYMIKNRAAFDKVLLEKFGIYDSTTLDDIQVPHSSVTKGKDVETTSVPVGVWKSLVESPERKEDTDGNSTYMVFVDGRICIANIQLNTASEIMRALTDDGKFSFKELSIKKKE